MQHYTPLHLTILHSPFAQLHSTVLFLCYTRNNVVFAVLHVIQNYTSARHSILLLHQVACPLQTHSILEMGFVHSTIVVTLNRQLGIWVSLIMRMNSQSSCTLQQSSLFFLNCFTETWFYWRHGSLSYNSCNTLSKPIYLLIWCPRIHSFHLFPCVMQVIIRRHFLQLGTRFTVDINQMAPTSLCTFTLAIYSYVL